ncbi:glycosyltransferase family 2 protein [Deltaproteobacteria bacterium TL4]
MKKLALSIVIPVYNCAPLMVQCLRSLERQTSEKSKFEVIVVDDGSTDDTVNTLKIFATHSELNLKIISATHGGPASARNQGIAHARTEWIAFIDSDIQVHSSWVNRAIQLIGQYPEMGGFEGRTELCDKGNITPFTHQTGNTSGNRYPTCNLILKKSLCHFYPGYKIPFREDTDLAFAILESGYQIKFDYQLVAFHPPLSPSYLRPICLAKRYYYDGLLKKRFPERYKNDVDVHYILRMRIPHLRRKIYSLFTLSQLGCLIALLPGVSYLAVSGLMVMHLLAYVAVVMIHTKNSDISQMKRGDFGVLMMVTYIVPWVMIVQLLRGHWAFKDQPQFIYIPAVSRPDFSLSSMDNKVIQMPYAVPIKKQQARSPIAVSL